MELGIVIWFTETEDYPEIMDNFTHFRTGLDWRNTGWVNSCHKFMKRAIDNGAKFTWGISHGGTITKDNFKDFRTAILKEAQWSQDNGVYEFQVGNEEEYRSDIPIPTFVNNMKSVATEVKQIFTRGNVSYSPSYTYFSEWAKQGKGDLDLIGGNIYRDNEYWNDPWFSDAWMKETDDLIKAFGTDGMYISEFNVSASNMDLFGKDKTLSNGIAEMIKYFTYKGINRAFFYTWKDYPGEGTMGIIDVDGSYRYLWDNFAKKEKVGISGIYALSGYPKIITRDGTEIVYNLPTVTENKYGALYSNNPYYDIYYHKYKDTSMVNPDRTRILVCKKGHKPQENWFEDDIPQRVIDGGYE